MKEDDAVQGEANTKRAKLRVPLGLAQMVGATVTLGLLVMTGIHEWTLAGVVITSMLTVISVLLFGGRRNR